MRSTLRIRYFRGFSTASIPTLSERGLVVMMPLILSAGSLLFTRHHGAVT